MGSDLSRWVWASTRPGSAMRPSPSRTGAPFGAGSAAMRPANITTSDRSPPSGRTLRTTRSAAIAYFLFQSQIGISLTDYFSVHPGITGRGRAGRAVRLMTGSSRYNAMAAFRLVKAGGEAGSWCSLDAPEADYPHFLKCISNRLHGFGHVCLGHVSHAADTEGIGQREATREDDEATLLHAFEQRLKIEG